MVQRITHDGTLGGPVNIGPLKIRVNFKLLYRWHTDFRIFFLWGLHTVLLQIDFKQNKTSWKTLVTFRDKKSWSPNRPPRWTSRSPRVGTIYSSAQAVILYTERHNSRALEMELHFLALTYQYKRGQRHNQRGDNNNLVLPLTFAAFFNSFLIRYSRCSQATCKWQVCPYISIAHCNAVSVASLKSQQWRYCNLHWYVTWKITITSVLSSASRKYLKNIMD